MNKEHKPTLNEGQNKPRIKVVKRTPDSPMPPANKMQKKPDAAKVQPKADQAQKAHTPHPSTAPHLTKKAPNSRSAEGNNIPNATQKNSAPFDKKIRRSAPKDQRRILSKETKSTPEETPRRRNDESYVFSRSLSETHERIMAERRERLEDARQFQKEDVRQKVRVGIIAFAASALIILIAVSIIISSALSSPKIKKSKGEYIYQIGSTTTEAAYADSVRNDMIYISMNSIAELCQLTLSGSASTGLRFTAQNGDWISFLSNSNEAKINGYGMSMPAAAYIDGNQCSIPLDFLEDILGGISVKTDLKERTVTVTRLEYVDSTPLEPHYVPIGFSLRTDAILTPLDENKYFKDQPIFAFKNDLSEYEQYMNPSDPENYLMLVNKQNPTPTSDYEPESLILIKGETRGYYLDAVAAKALEAMLKEMYSEGFTDIYVTSGYRSYSRQKGLYESYIADEMKKDPSLTLAQATERASYYSAPPGKSEHHTGLAVDLMSTTMSELDETFADNEAYDWLLANAWKFGFILRYPADKTDITGYVFEPWHWRFVGRSTALEILRSGECFEEYLESLNQ